MRQTTHPIILLIITNVSPIDAVCFDPPAASKSETGPEEPPYIGYSRSERPTAMMNNSNAFPIRPSENCTFEQWEETIRNIFRIPGVASITISNWSPPDDENLSGLKIGSIVILEPEADEITIKATIGLLPYVGWVMGANEEVFVIGPCAS